VSNVLYSYFDNVTVFIDTFQEHLSNVFSALRKADLKLKPTKCYFAPLLVSATGVSPDKAKIATVLSYPVPVDLKELRQFLGFINYYQSFLHNYSKITEPLNKLLTVGKEATHRNETQLVRKLLQSVSID